VSVGRSAGSACEGRSSRAAVIQLALALWSGCHGGELGGRWDLRCRHALGCQVDSGQEDNLDAGGGVHADAADGTVGPGELSPDGGGPGDELAPDAGDGGAHDAGADASYVWPVLEDGGLLEALAEYVAPHVIFVDQTPRVRVFGSLLLSAAKFPVFVDGKLHGPFEAISDSEGYFQLTSKLSKGEHFVQVGAPAGPPRPGARLVAAERVQYADADLAITAGPAAFVYDPERSAFFFVFSTEAQTSRLGRIRFDGLRWRFDDLDLPKPLSVTLTPDGRELLVANANSAILRVDPDSFSLTGTEVLTTSYGTSGFGEIYALADGQVLLRESYRLWQYPGLTALQTPDTNSPNAYLSQDQTRLLWADGDLSFHPGTVYSYAAGTPGVFTGARFLGGGNYGGVISISGDGRRASQYGDIYDESLNYLGALVGADTASTVALSGNGKVAVAHLYSDPTLRAYDLSSPERPFPALGQPIKLFADNNGGVYRMAVDEAGTTAFGFAMHFANGSSGQPDHYFLVRKLPRPSL
jgi:hypothetical protein